MTHDGDSGPFETAEHVQRVKQSLASSIVLAVIDLVWYVTVLFQYMYARTKFSRGDMCTFCDQNGTLSYDLTLNEYGHLCLKDVLFNVDHVIICSIEMNSLRSVKRYVRLTIDNVGSHCVMVKALDPFTGIIHMVKYRSLKKIT